MSKLIAKEVQANEILKIPTYTTITRDQITFEEGSVIYNSTTEQVEIYYFQDWRNIGNVTSAVSTLNATGGSITTVGKYKIHTFTGDSFFVVTEGSAECEYLVIAGGAGGGGWGGGGGAGGYRCSVIGEFSGAQATSESRFTAIEGTYSVTVGAGGARGTNGPYVKGGTGEDSSITGPGVSVTSFGGGGGGNWSTGSGNNGGCGGGGSGTGAGGIGTPGQGFNGGPGQGSQSSPYQGHDGGGGAGAVGDEGSGVTGGNGGDRVSSLITGQAIFRAGGGGGHSPALGNPAYALGGNGGGGDSGSYYTQKAATDGLGSSGSGGGGAYGSQPAYQCGAGGSGVVIIRYEI